MAALHPATKLESVRRFRASKDPQTCENWPGKLKPERTSPSLRLLLFSSLSSSSIDGATELLRGETKPQMFGTHILRREK